MTLIELLTAIGNLDAAIRMATRAMKTGSIDPLQGDRQLGAGLARHRLARHRERFLDVRGLVFIQRCIDATDAEEARERREVADADGIGLGYEDWRLPTRAELSSIAEREQCLRDRGPEAWQEHVDALTRLAAEPDLAIGMGERGRAGFLAAYERQGRQLSPSLRILASETFLPWK